MQQIEQAIMKAEQGDIEEAISLLRNYQNIASDDEKFSIAQVYQQWGLVDHALPLLEELHAAYPEEEEVTLSLAEAYTDLDQDEKALELLNRFQEEDEGYLQALIQSADLYQSQGLFEVAENKLFKAKRMAPDEPLIDLALGELAFHTGDYKKSIPHYEKAIKKGRMYGEVDVKLRLAEAFAAIGEIEKAIEFYKDVKTESPDVLFRYGFTAYQGDRNEMAIGIWQKLLDRDPYYHSVYPLLAKAYEEEGMLKEAYETLKKGLIYDEYNKQLYFLAGKIALKLNQHERAIELVEKALSIDPGYKEAVLFLIEHYKKNENHKRIKEMLTDVIKMGEDDPLYYWELARANYEIEAYDDALNNYREAYNSFTNDAEFLKEYGYFLVEEGRMEEAKNILHKYVNIEPHDRDVEEFISRMET
ncbi:tetratricopeptide repeat protein [Melghiribacillus thermohalophilus]|uniref:Tetratricopeptide repeat protein n=1 Tax=Melghiribacillus thermohalophilus TaxID=1324956 RepID=A0A4R3N8R2_9BACI|nr:tetratricopeptide repeat protein [Melghiribacillus thermohalophilus]TCT25568.1 tetratricopeptide repeat protein [Melghiribacillus thermohalophilus]